MAEKIHVSLKDISETLFMTLYARARETQHADPMIRDDLAVNMVNRIDIDFSRYRMQRHDEIAVIMRMNRFDRHVQKFLSQSPEAVVVHIGCGLDSRFERVDNGKVEWFDLDLPDVIALRQELMPISCSRYHTLAVSVLDDRWIEDVSRMKPGPFMFIAEGVFPYFEETQVKALFLKLRNHFTGCHLVCDAHTPFVIWVDNLQLAAGKVKARLHWSIKNGRQVETWGEGIHLLEEWNYYDADEPRLRSLRWVRLIPPLAKSSGIFHYQLGER